MKNWDYNLFLTLNFDGGEVLDSVMLLASGKMEWVPLYLLILWLQFKQGGWRRVLYFLIAAVAVVALSDMIAGIFKHTGPLKNVWAEFPARLRPIHTPELEGMIHVLSSGGLYGTVSAHAATTLGVALISGYTLRRKWVWGVMMLYALLVAYSRIYLGVHFPQDILLGWLTGALSALFVTIIYHFFER